MQIKFVLRAHIYNTLLSSRYVPEHKTTENKTNLRYQQKIIRDTKGYHKYFYQCTLNKDKQNTK